MKKKMLMLQVMNSIFEVMETMFYFTVEEKKEVTSDLSLLFDFENLKASCITFSGAASGRIYLLIPLTVITSMTRNFLGQDRGSLSEELVDATLKEALNMIAGSALTKLDKVSYMGLGIPELVDPFTIKIQDNLVALKTKDGVMASVVQLDD